MVTADSLQAHSATAVAQADQTCKRHVKDCAVAADQGRLGDLMGATAMSIDTPSYARSLGMGHVGFSQGFGGSPFQMSQDLAQSMSIDGGQAEQLSHHGAAAACTG